MSNETPEIPPVADNQEADSTTSMSEAMPKAFQPEAADIPVVEAEEQPPAMMDSFSSEDLGIPEEIYEPEPEVEADIASFDLLGIANPNFPQLDMGRAEVYASTSTLRTFTKLVDGLETSGDVGMRKGLGLWMTARHEEAAEQLASFISDDVAAFTMARALGSLGRWEEAHKIYVGLTDKYPEERRPRLGMLETKLEIDLAADDTEAAVGALQAAIEAAPASFHDGPEHHYLTGRSNELQRNWEEALEGYADARDQDPANRENLFRFAHLAERFGLDHAALEAYENLAAMLPIETTVLLNLGVLYEDLGRDQDAAACYETVTRHDPMNTRALRYLLDARAAIDMYYDEDQERMEDRLNQVLRIPITDFELSVRARNCLNRMNINTIGDLVGRTEQELLSYKNFGETSLKEIKEILTSKGLRLGMSHDEAVSSVESTTEVVAPVSTDPDDINNRSLAELNLSIRARRTVETLGCLTFGDVLKHSSDELLGMPNFGVTSLNELKAKLKEVGLGLRGDN